MEANGTPEPKLPVIQVAWNDAIQDVGLQFDTKEFRNWDFLIYVLDKGKRRAEELKQQSQMQQAMAEQQAMQLRNNLRL